MNTIHQSVNTIEVCKKKNIYDYLVLDNWINNLDKKIHKKTPQNKNNWLVDI